MTPSRIGIYGGTFSPVHLGHIRAAQSFLAELSPDRLYVVPTAEPPHKREVGGASAEERLYMTRLAFEGLDRRIEVSDFEVKRRGKSYTVYTLEHFAAPERELYMLVGTDMFLTLDRWYRAGEIFALSNIVLMRRENETELGCELRRKRDEYTARYGAKIYEIDRPPFELSSTELREYIRSGRPTEGLISPRVAEYIYRNGLYGTEKPSDGSAYESGRII